MNKRIRLTRRELLGTAAAAAVTASPAAKAVGPLIITDPKPDDEVRLGVIGFRSRGNGIKNWAEGVDGVRVTALCDVDEQVLAKGVDEYDKKGRKVFAHKDMRRMFDRDDVDAVLIATPNHWHALASIWACQAGKDVYVEKPVAHNVFEGRKMVEAARKYDRIVQAGLQNRSDSGQQALKSWMKGGRLGKLQFAHAYWFNLRQSIGKVDRPTPIPGHIDYDLFCGPRDVMPLMRKNLHYDWHWQWPYGCGEFGNVAVHNLDEARMMAGLGAPTRFMHVGERYMWNDDGHTPNMSFSVFECDGVPLIIETGDLPNEPGSSARASVMGRNISTYIQYENGYTLSSRGGGSAFLNDGTEIKKFPGDGGHGHMQNFIDCVRSRNRNDLVTEIEEGHVSTMICNLANNAHRLGRPDSVGEIRNMVGEVPVAAEAFDRLPAQLGRLGVDLDAQPLKVGGWYDFDPKTERIIGGDMMDVANGMLTEAYRSPFVVPDRV